MNTSEGPRQEPTVSPLGRLRAERQEIALLGGNDAEIPTVDAIINRFERGEISEEKALEEIITIKNTKQDYH